MSRLVYHQSLINMTLLIRDKINYGLQSENVIKEHNSVECINMSLRLFFSFADITKSMNVVLLRRRFRKSHIVDYCFEIIMKMCILMAVSDMIHHLKNYLDMSIWVDIRFSTNNWLCRTRICSCVVWFTSSINVIAGILNHIDMCVCQRYYHWLLSSEYVRGWGRLSLCRSCPNYGLWKLKDNGTFNMQIPIVQLG